TGPRYQLFENNCNHFCSDLCWALLRRRPPDWINRTAEKCARQNRLKHSKEQAQHARVRPQAIQLNG
ncbi:unnamed protein product, partial [Durusdinium trenchii]